MQDFPEMLRRSGLLCHWSGVVNALATPLGPVVLNDPISSDNLQWRDHDLDGIGNTDFGCDCLDLLPSYSAT